MARYGVLTGGGDCPGLNAGIRAIVRRGANDHGHEFFGFRYGWAGVLAGDGADLTAETTRGILPRGGTILGTSRTNPYKEDGGLERVRASLADRGIDGVIPIGGGDTPGGARRGADDGNGRARRPAASTSPACPRRSTTTSRAQTSPSVSRPRCRSPPTRSTASTRRRSP